MARVAASLVGRAAELDALENALARLRGAGANAVLVMGEPGIGKTRLLAELAARADSAGCLVLTGSASELERDLPLSIFVDALDEYVAGMDPRRLRRGARSCRTSVTVRIARCASCWERLAGTRPLVLVLDDVH